MTNDSNDPRPASKFTLREALLAEIEKPGTITKSRIKAILAETLQEDMRSSRRAQAAAWSEGVRTRWPRPENPYEDEA